LLRRRVETKRRAPRAAAMVLTRMAQLGVSPRAAAAAAAKGCCAWRCAQRTTETRAVAPLATRAVRFGAEKRQHRYCPQMIWESIFGAGSCPNRRSVTPPVAVAAARLLVRATNRSAEAGEGPPNEAKRWKSHPSNPCHVGAPSSLVERVRVHARLQQQARMVARQ
jgi:hypothetical protein